ncbi:PIG-L family deacetylase [Cohnella yongneupensis]|uniref:PIG-L family deacetylase n=1 Tax=Cohnella yongneupensis TaxID=425006 RepID=A0ABW0R2Z5_9BACL
MTKRKILAVFAHPDDETFICGGTLAKYASMDVDITLVSATRGEMGRRMGNPPYVNRETMPEVRELELRNACDALGVRQLIFFDIRDKTVEFIDLELLTSRIAALIEEIKPDVVLTFHEILGGHPDHCAIGKVTTAAHERTRERSGAELFFITFGDTLANAQERFGYDYPNPIVRIDISKHHDAKLAAFRAHRCQTEIDGWVWGPDKQALSKFGKYEYFIAGNKAIPPHPGEDLFPPSKR